jgi:hypothetical protein
MGRSPAGIIISKLILFDDKTNRPANLMVADENEM